MLNIHPAIVHTPIGLLTIYSIIELLRFKKIQERSYLFYTKAVMVIVGFGGAIVAYLTGDMIEHAFESDRALIEIHSNFAFITAFIYGIIGASYLVKWFEKEFGTMKFLKNPTMAKIFAFKVKVANILQKPSVLVTLAALGFVAVFITGCLGGAIAYGPDADPAVSFVYHLFF